MNKIRNLISVFAAVSITVCITCSSVFAGSLSYDLDENVGPLPGTLTVSGQSPAYPAFQYVASGTLSTKTYTADMLQITVNGNAKSASSTRSVYGSYGYSSKPSSVKYRCQIWLGSQITDCLAFPTASQLW